MGKSRSRAIQYMIMASILWSIGGLFIKLVDWNPMAIAGARSGIAAIVILCYLKKPKVVIDKPTILSAFSYTALLILFVTANKLTTSANAILLQFTAPIWVALLARWFLKEKIRTSDWVTIVIVLLGMYLFFIGDLQPGHMLGNIAAVLAGVAMAFMIIFIKLRTKGSPVEVTLLGNIITFLLALPFFFRSIPSWHSVSALLILGIFQLGISYILYTSAVPHVSAIEAILLPILEPLLNPLWVFIATKEAPSPYSILGGLVVILAIVSRSLYQARKSSPLSSQLEEAQ